MAASETKQQMELAVQSQPVERVASGKQEIGFRVDIREITHISTAQQTYGIKGVLKMSWRASDADVSLFEQGARGADYAASFVPRVEWTNDVETHDYDVGAVTVKRDKKSGVWYNAQSIKFNTTFTEEFEVVNFPFDVQDLSMVFHEAKHNVWVPHHTMDNYLKLDKAWSSITHWELDRIAASSADIPYQSGRRGSYQKVTCKVQVRRKWKGVIYRLISWLLILGIMSWSTFSVHPSDIGDRLSYAITMALTIVAFQFIISSQLPQVNYMTMLDRYNLFIFVFVMLVTLESSLVGYHGDGLFADSEAVDNYFAAAAGLCFVGGNVAFAVLAVRARRSELGKLGSWQPYRIDSLYVGNDEFPRNQTHDYAKDRT